MNCDKLKKLEIPESVDLIHAGAFTYLNENVDITLPQTFQVDGDRFFAYCEFLTSFTIPDNWTVKDMEKLF